MSAISPTSSVTSTTDAPGSTRVPLQVMGQDDFLQLLVAQMTSQDPLNPQSDTEFISQMAQFSALEQSKAMQANMATLQASGMLGKTVKVQVDPENDPELVVQGAVTAVEMEAGTPKLIVNGQPFTLDQVLTIEPTVGGTSTP